FSCARSTSVRRSTVAVVSPGGMPVAWLPLLDEPDPSSTAATVPAATSATAASAAMRARRRRGLRSPDGRPSSAKLDRVGGAPRARCSASDRGAGISSFARVQAERGAATRPGCLAGGFRGGAAAVARLRAPRASPRRLGQVAFTGFLCGLECGVFFGVTVQVDADPDAAALRFRLHFAPMAAHAAGEALHGVFACGPFGRREFLLAALRAVARAGLLGGFHDLRTGAVDPDGAAAGTVRRRDVDAVCAHAPGEVEDLLFVIRRGARAWLRAGAAGGEGEACQRAGNKQEGLGGEGHWAPFASAMAPLERTMSTSSPAQLKAT